MRTAGDQPWMAPLTLAALSVVGLVAACCRSPRLARARDRRRGLDDPRRLGCHSAERLLRLAIPGEILFLDDREPLRPKYPGLCQSRSVSLGCDVGAPAHAVVRRHRRRRHAGRAYCLENRVEYGLIPLGATGASIALSLLGALTPPLLGTFLILGLLGVSCSFIFVPLNAILQWRSPPDRRGAVISFSNTCVFTGILLGSLAGGSLANAGFSTSNIFLITAGVTIVGTLWALWLMPDVFLRLLLVILTNTLYRLRIVGQQHIPQSGGALLVPNHMSFVDGFLLMASIDRPIRFVVDAAVCDAPLFKWLMAAMKVIPIASAGGPRMILRALRNAGQALDDGEIVCIFPEGQITRTGTLLPFRRGFERIVKGRQVPVIPTHLDRVWGSIFSFERGRFLTKMA